MPTERDFRLGIDTDEGMGLNKNLCIDMRSIDLFPYLVPGTIVQLLGKYPPDRKSKIPTWGNWLISVENQWTMAKM